MLLLSSGKKKLIFPCSCPVPLILYDFGWENVGMAPCRLTTTTTIEPQFICNMSFVFYECLFGEHV